MAEKSGYMKNVAAYIAAGYSESEAMQNALLDMGIDMGWDFVGGMISGSIMGSGGKVVSNVVSNSLQQLQNYNTGKNILSTNGGVDALLNSADQVRSVSSADMQNKLTAQIDKVSQNPTARNVGQLNATVQAANNQLNQADVAQQLISKGVSSKKVNGIAEAITARLNGQELTRTQKYILSSALNSSAVRDTISEFVQKKSNGIDSTLKNAYDEINTIGGNKNGRETALWNLQNQRADGSLLSSQTQTRAEDGNGSGVPGTLREIGGLPAEALSATQRRGLTSEVDVFGDNDYATGMQGSSLHQVQKAVPKGIYAGGSKTRTFREATQQDADLIIGIKTRYNAGKTRNAASARGTINGKSIALECISGKFSHDNYYNMGNFEPPQPENYHYQGPIPEYTNHTEQKIVEYLREQFKDNPNVSGEIEIISERIYCDNCKVVFWMSQGCMFCFFSLTEGDDPPVYFYNESGEDRFIKVADSIVEFLVNRLEMSKNLFKEK